MRFPWAGPRQENSELEALQTDVMRFIAILGLCLAAIFSLVHSAAREHREVDVPIADLVPVAPVKMDSLPQPQAPPQVIKTQRDAEVPIDDREDERSGFTLEFASGEALLRLLKKGRVNLYVRSGEQFWSVDGYGSLATAQAPGEFYQMAADTVPSLLRNAAPPGGVPVWGVTLAEDVGRAIAELVDVNDHGNIAITASGEVILEAR